MHDAYLCREWFLKEKCVLLKFYAILLVFTLEEHVEKTTNLNCRNVNFLQHKKMVCQLLKNQTAYILREINGLGNFCLFV